MASWANVSGGVRSQVEVHPDPRPSKRYKASRDEWAAIHEHFRGQTVLGTQEGYNPDSPAHCLHHIAFKKADGGDDVVENLAPLLTVDHVRFHDHAPGWERVAVAIRSYVLLNRGRCVYVVGKIGWDRLSSRYPLLPEPKEGTGTADPHVAPADFGSESDWDKYEEPIWRMRPPDSDDVEGYSRPWQGPF